MFPENKEWLRETYFNAARRADRGIAKVISSLDELHMRENTVILVVGDHGEELFDNGYLGHGVSLSFDSYQTVGKLVNSPWKAPAGPIGMSDVSTLIHNSLVMQPDAALSVDPEVLCYVGYANRPQQIGLATAGGLVRYDFRNNTWAGQAHLGASMLPAAPTNHVIHVWESYVIKRIQKGGDAAKR
jgi:arylsulfatase A-like enzyme